MIEHSKEIMTTLMEMVNKELEYPEKANTDEIYKVVDIIKDIAETAYYWNFAEEKASKIDGNSSGTIIR